MFLMQVSLQVHAVMQDAKHVDLPACVVGTKHDKMPTSESLSRHMQGVNIVGQVCAQMATDDVGSATQIEERRTQGSCVDSGLFPAKMPLSPTQDADVIGIHRRAFTNCPAFVIHTEPRASVVIVAKSAAKACAESKV